MARPKWTAGRNPKPQVYVEVETENGVPLFRVPKAVSGSELEKDDRLKKPKIPGWRSDF